MVSYTFYTNNYVPYFTEETDALLKAIIIYAKKQKSNKNYGILSPYIKAYKLLKTENFLPELKKIIKSTKQEIFLYEKDMLTKLSEHIKDVDNIRNFASSALYSFLIVPEPYLPYYFHYAIAKENESLKLHRIRDDLWNEFMQEKKITYVTDDIKDGRIKPFTKITWQYIYAEKNDQTVEIEIPFTPENCMQMQEENFNAINDYFKNIYKNLLTEK